VRIPTADDQEANLDEDHWNAHIVTEHFELLPYQRLVIETLQRPEFICRGKRDPTTKIYQRTYENIFIGDKRVERISLRVFVRETSGFVVTAFFAEAEFRGLGEKIWPL